MRYSRRRAWPSRSLPEPRVNVGRSARWAGRLSVSVLGAILKGITIDVTTSVTHFFAPQSYEFDLSRCILMGKCKRVFGNSENAQDAMVLP